MKETKRIVRDRRKMKGKRVIAGILLAGILAVTLAGCKNTDNTKEETEKPVITLGSDNYPPYNYLNEDGVPTGIDVELATEAFKRMGYQVEVVQINWEKKKELVESGEIDCIMGCFSMEGRLDDYRWAGPYIASRQVVAVNENSDIYKLSDLEGKNLAVQSVERLRPVDGDEGHVALPLQFDESHPAASYQARRARMLVIFLTYCWRKNRNLPAFAGFVAFSRGKGCGESPPFP